MIKSRLNISKYLVPGDVCTSIEPAVYKTVLGSCVAICVHDRSLKTGGMNHFIYADSKGNFTTDSYGDISCENLIKKMISSGSELQNLTAMVFGGASSHLGTNIFSPGIKNIEMAKYILQKWTIPVTSEELGGCFGRTVIFQTDTNEATIEKLNTCLRVCPPEKRCEHFR